MGEWGQGGGDDRLPILSDIPLPQMAFAFAGTPLYPEVQVISAALRTERVHPPSPTSQSVPPLSVPTGSSQVAAQETIETKNFKVRFCR